MHFLKKTSPLYLLIGVLFIYTIYDYFEHILREDSIFQKHPWYWLLFSFSALVSFVVIMHLFKKGIEIYIKKKSLFIEIVGFIVWMVLYLAFIGKLINTLFWPFNELYFKFNLIIILIGTAIFTVLRILINIAIKQPILYSK